MLFNLTDNTTLQAQIRGIVVEKETGLAIPFASIAWKKNGQQKGLIADIRGSFEVADEDASQLLISCTGYQKSVFDVPAVRPGLLRVELLPKSKELDEILVNPGVNPAVRIIRNLLKNKKTNNFKNYPEYRFYNYCKTNIDVKKSDDSLINKTGNSKTASDSSEVRNRSKQLKMLDKQLIFVSEYVVSTIKSNGRELSNIIAHKTSGLKEPILTESFNLLFHNTISFYENRVSLFKIQASGDIGSSEFVSPAADNCLNLYSYELEDASVQGSDTIFILNFEPRKGRTFQGLKGKMYVSSNGYAIRDVVVEPVLQGLVAFKFRQQYAFRNQRWFPSRLEEEIGWIGQKIRGMGQSYGVYLITSVLEDVRYSPAGKDEVNAAESFSVASVRQEQSDSLLRKYRSDTLNNREKNAILFLDSVGKKIDLDGKIRFIPKLGAGKLAWKFVDFDLNRIYSYNMFEGTRLGLGVSSNEKISRTFGLGGFAGYGFSDKRVKFGAFGLINFPGKMKASLKLSYQDNLREAGTDVQDVRQIPAANELFRSYIATQMEQCLEKKAEFSIRLYPFLSLRTAVCIRKFQPLYELPFFLGPIPGYQADEFQVHLRYAPGTDFAKWGGEELETSTGNPVFNISYHRGINSFNQESIHFGKLEASFDFVHFLPRLGQTNLRLAGGYTGQKLPYGMLFTGEGSRADDFPILFNQYFQTMAPYEFLSDRFLNLFFTHNFGSLLFKSSRFRPQLLIMQNSGIGSLRNIPYAPVGFKTKEKIFLETGIIINQIVKINYLNAMYFGLGGGIFYRYGYYAGDRLQDNLVYKLSTTFSIN